MLETGLRYILIQSVGLAGALAVFLMFGRRLGWRPLHIVVGVMVLLTALFDNCLVAMAVFYYTPNYASGWLVGRAPVEDFAYALAAAVLMPTLWEKLRRKL